MTQKVLAKLISFAGCDKLGLFKIALASSCLMIVPQGQVRAASIFIANHSFEAPIITDPSGILDTGMSTTGNWTFAGAMNQGFINPGVGENDVPGFWYGSPPNLPLGAGSQVAWSNGGTISQTLTETLQANTKYTLGVYVGHRQNVAFAGYNIELLAGATVLASNNSITPAAGTFAPVTVSYTSGSSGSLLGQALQIRLTSNGEQANFDLITLDASPIPEPSAMLGLLGFGLLGIASKLRQKP